MTVNRTRELPVREAQGRILIPHAVAEAVARGLASFRSDAGIPHEGLLYLAGRVVDQTALALVAIIPPCDHSPYRVVADERSIGLSARQARGLGLGLIAQVHSHPGWDNRHSDGDDDLILLPFEGMFSLVVSNYASKGFTHETVGVHQYQAGRWVRMASPAQALVFVPEEQDLRA